MTVKNKESGSAQGQMGNLRTMRSNTYKTATAIRVKIQDAKKRVKGIHEAIGVKHEEMAAERLSAETAAAAAAEERARLEAEEAERAAELKRAEEEKVERAADAARAGGKSAEGPVGSAPEKDVSPDKPKAAKDKRSSEKSRDKSAEKAQASDKSQSADKSRTSDKVQAAEKAQARDNSAEKPQTAEKSQVSDKAQTVEKPKAQEPVVVKSTNPNETTRVYTDDKGVVKVRRFLTEIPKAPRESKPQGRGQKPAGAARQGAADRPSRPGQPKPSDSFKGGFGKDKDDAQRTSRPSAPRGGAPRADFMPAPAQKQRNFTGKTQERTEEKKSSPKSKHNMLVRSYEDYDRDVVRRPRPKKAETKFEPIIKKIDHAVVNTEEIVIKDLSEKIGVSVAEIIKKLFAEGIIKTINDKIDFTVAEYVSSLFGVTLTLKLEQSAEDTLNAGVKSDEDNLPDTEKRAPIVTVMGHVDHGKTSLLDAIRNTNVTKGEAGGITQAIGAYQVVINGEPITFIDTPGHEAFTAMRARGAQVTDIAVIVVAADDGVMPQTVEAINHAKAAGVPIVVAINKTDKPTANPDVVKTQLTEYGIVPEEWGGDNIMVNVSAKTGAGIKELLEAILIVAEVRELKANPAKRASGTIIEAKLDKNRGPVATALVQNGTLRVGDYIIAGTADGKVKAMFDEKGRGVKEAGPSMPVEVLGFSAVPNAGDVMFSVDEKLGKQVASERKDKEKLARTNVSAAVSLDDLYSKISEENMKNLNLIIKTDVQGSLEALKSSLIKVSNDEVKVSPIHGGVGAITESDVMLAKASNAIIIGFNVRADSNAKAAAEREGVDIRIYRIIYDAVDDVTAAMRGMLAPKYKETILGTAEVREVFRISGVGTVAGCYVTGGKISRGSKVRVYRDNVVVTDCEMSALKRFKDDVKEVAQGYECGISLVNYNDIKVGDVFENYVIEEIKEK